MGLFDWLQDEDNDGSRMDEGMQAAADVGGSALIGLGGLAAGVGGFVLAGGAATTATAVGAPLGIPAAGVGGLLMAGGAAAAGLGELMGTDTGQAIAEEQGDFVADLFGTRGAPTNPDQAIEDPHYAAGRTDGIGQRMNRGARRLGREIRELAEEHPIRPMMGNPTPPMPSF